ncbi:hypothetical protein B0J11DRAFT_534647 [Dendryphion nanum]|uniref:Uncharacterized protein n=1 Tax=Dendryphion nanum TaxID=256645 RepID=A0A9P9DIG5_9PLEO|nr:hypothetical protein B0J11DRAFT_534647 [Dendryphion nanum]
MLTPGSANLASPIGQPPTRNPDTLAERIDSSAYDIQRPTCSLNIVCYRGGTKGCVLRQIQTALKSRFPDDMSFEKTRTRNSQLVTNDEEFFQELRRLYWSEMSGFWRRHLSLKTLTGLRLLTYSPSRRPTVVPLDDFVLQEIYYAYKHPKSITTDDDWIQWVFRLRRRNKRHALEFVEGWNSTRVIIAAAVPWMISCLVGIIWTAIGGDAQTAFTVAGFILTSGTVILALLAVISGIESSGRSLAS